MTTLKTLDIHAAAIIRAVKANANITVADLHNDLELGSIDGWMAIVQRHRMTFAQWSGAMERAIAALEA